MPQQGVACERMRQHRMVLAGDSGLDGDERHGQELMWLCISSWRWRHSGLFDHRLGRRQTLHQQQTWTYDDLVPGLQGSVLRDSLSIDKRSSQATIVFDKYTSWPLFNASVAPSNPP